ncbi:MAG: peptidylprolyl isomerase [Chitinophagaceae bacterium]|jgi:peptidyl-prolyl cis-trans isomerase SurA|nr:peptidylprolyl isomerase [Chitinophagaceae bacterium]MBK7677859.1 peptidylprolyl isomerase [Chitinophagaceae bacterium]MBK8300339.1 peptidylprolyl isomerase [Chitinophagaceae bacterium]MBK9658496.1 peptidylprolyl isomerase [Chitinophagaceae bacterium]MBK9938920.1 peptidylprolyl isomerase [Chitinophagaceae bacterium]
MLNIKRILTACFLLVCFTTVAQSQAKKVVADKIAAVVGDRIILKSDITNSILDIARQGGTVPENAECLLMEQAIVSKVLMLQAEKDSLPVTDDEVEAELDQKIRYYINQLGSQEALEEMAGKSIYQIKDDARESVKEQKLSGAMQRKIVDNVRITPNEVKAFFDKIPTDSLPFYESELEICQVISYPKASRDLEQYIIGEMNNYKRQIETKITTFDALAKKVSEDPGSKDRGGQYQINRNEKSWDPIFMSTAFRLKEGDISLPVKSKFGYHIIQMVQRNGDDAIVRHILRIPPVTDDEIKQASKKLDSVRTNIIAGKLSFNAAASKYSDDESAKFAGPCITNRDGSTYVTIDALDKDMVGMLGKMKIGDISLPAAYTDEQGKKGVRIVYLKSRSEPHRMNLHDDYSRISQFALEEKKAKAMEKWMVTKLPTYYISVDTQTEAECPQLKKFAAERKSF